MLSWHPVQQFLGTLSYSDDYGDPRIMHFILGASHAKYIYI